MNHQDVLFYPFPAPAMCIETGWASIRNDRLAQEDAALCSGPTELPGRLFGIMDAIAMVADGTLGTREQVAPDEKGRTPGGLAARMAVEIVAERVYQSLIDEGMDRYLLHTYCPYAGGIMGISDRHRHLQAIRERLESHDALDSLGPKIRDAIRTAHWRIRSQTTGLTTLTVAYLIGRRLIIGHVGDSVAVLLGQSRRPIALTETMRDGDGAVTSLLGMRGSPRIQILDSILPDPPVWILIATDGFMFESFGDCLLGSLNTHHGCPEIAGRLVEEARVAGSTDNISVAIIRVTRKETPLQDARWNASEPTASVNEVSISGRETGAAKNLVVTAPVRTDSRKWSQWARLQRGWKRLIRKK